MKLSRENKLIVTCGKDGTIGIFGEENMGRADMLNFGNFVICIDVFTVFLPYAKVPKHLGQWLRALCVQEDGRVTNIFWGSQSSTIGTAHFGAKGLPERWLKICMNF